MIDLELITCPQSGTWPYVLVFVHWLGSIRRRAPVLSAHHCLLRRAMSSVRVIHASYVNVPATAAPPPGPIKLTAMEAPWVVLPELQHVLLYEGQDMPPFDDILLSLRSSLAATLGSFAPLAGKLVHLEDTGDVAIACSTSDGVRFVVAECDGDMRHLAGDEEHDVRVLERLVPGVDMGELPTPVLAVQATRFEGGVAVGVTVHHGVADGRSLWTFVEAWAAACRGEAHAVTAPSFDRSLVKLPGGEELARSLLRKYAPNVPKVAMLAPPLVEDCARTTRRTFSLDSRDTSNASRSASSVSAKPTARPRLAPRPTSSPSPRSLGRASSGASRSPRTTT
ncbi:hypothetical protein CFC21_032425 [Triticum aestivum]|nr:hypothetical protein CFC21_032425 [Triticum aestivum]